MKAKYWVLVAAAVVPLLACSSDGDDSGSGGDAGTGGSVVGGSGGSIVAGSGGSAAGETGGAAGTAGTATGGTAGSSTGGTAGTTSSCPAGTTEIDNGGQCMCALPCTAGDDTLCSQAMAGAHCCDFSAAGLGYLCGADQQSACDSLIGSACGAGGGSSGGMACDALTGGQVPECDTCAAASCVSQCNACNSNADCIGLLGCIMKCSDQTCANNCASQFPNGVNDYNTFGTCIQQSCPACLGG